MTGLLRQGASRMPKILIAGHARHGKDTLAEMLRDIIGLSFQSSSMFSLNKFLFGYLNHYRRGARLPAYRSPSEAYADRNSCREVWFKGIADYNTPNESRLAEDILEVNDAYIGMRRYAEFIASRHLFDLTIFVDASNRLPKEGKGSMELKASDFNLVISNNGSREQLYDTCVNLCKLFKTLRLEPTPDVEYTGRAIQVERELDW